MATLSITGTRQSSVWVGPFSIGKPPVQVPHYLYVEILEILKRANQIEEISLRKVFRFEDGGIEDLDQICLYHYPKKDPFPISLESGLIKIAKALWESIFISEFRDSEFYPGYFFKIPPPELPVTAVKSCALPEEAAGDLLR